jgi:integrase/recombinase XerD
MAKKTYIREKINKCCCDMASDYKELVLSFAEHMVNMKFSEHTITGRCAALKIFISFLAADGAVRIQDVDAIKIEHYRGYLVKRGLKENTVDYYFRSVKSLYNYLEKNAMIFEHPFQKIVLHRPKMSIQDILTVDEVNRFLSALDTGNVIGLRNRAIFETFYATGIRREELLSLKVFDVDTDKEYVRVFGKGKKERILPLGKHASKHIALYLKYSRVKILRKDLPDDDNLLFIGYQGAGPTLNQFFFKAICEKAKITKHVSCHTFRRTCATHMLANGAHPLMIAEMLGHSGLKTLRQYLKISIKEIQETHSRLKPGK